MLSVAAPNIIGCVEDCRSIALSWIYDEVEIKIDQPNAQVILDYIAAENPSASRQVLVNGTYQLAHGIYHIQNQNVDLMVNYSKNSLLFYRLKFSPTGMWSRIPEFILNSNNNFRNLSVAQFFCQIIGGMTSMTDLRAAITTMQDSYQTRNLIPLYGIANDHYGQWQFVRAVPHYSVPLDQLTNGIKTILSSIHINSIARRYLIHGPNGSGKTAVASIIAECYSRSLYIMEIGDWSLTNEVFRTAIQTLPSNSVLLIDQIDQGLANLEAMGKRRPLNLSTILSSLRGAVPLNSGVMVILTARNLNAIDEQLITKVDQIFQLTEILNVSPDDLGDWTVVE